jgi:hypothetical protein
MERWIRLADLVRPDLETDQRVRPKGVGDWHVGGVAALSDEHPADSRHVVARIKGVPPPAEIVSLLKTPERQESGCSRRRSATTGRPSQAQVCPCKNSQMPQMPQSFGLVVVARLPMIAFLAAIASLISFRLGSRAARIRKASTTRASGARSASSGKDATASRVSACTEALA